MARVPCDAGRSLGGLAVPSRRRPQRPSPRGDHGHAHLDRHARGVGMVGRRPRRRAGRAQLLRGRRRDHHADPARPVLRGARPPALGRGDPRPARARRKEAPSCATGRMSCRSAGCNSATCSSSAQARRSPPTASSSRASAIDQSMLTGESVPVEVATGADVAGTQPSAPTVGWSCATHVGADTALAQIARLVAEAQAGERRSSGSSTASRRCSCPSSSGSRSPPFSSR